MPLITIGFGVLGASLASTFSVSLLTGWAIGSLIGSLFAPGTNTTVSGPRLENTSASASNIIGNPIQIAYGTCRVPGSIIWSNTITEVKNEDKQSSGGSIGGGSSQTTVTYEYYLDFAVAICEGPITGIKKIWVNNKIIYDQDGAIQQEPWLLYDLYIGSETQGADPTMESVLGVGNVPAYRGLAYIVFKQFDLKEYGNRAPQQIEFEVVAAGGASGTYTLLREAIEEYFQSGISYQTGSCIYKIDNDTKIAGNWSYSREGHSHILDISAIKTGGYFYKGGNEVTDVGARNSAYAAGYRLAAQSLVGVNLEGHLVTMYTSQEGSGAAPSNYDWIAIYRASDGKLLHYKNVGKHDSGSFFFENRMAWVLNTYEVTFNSEVSYHTWRYCAGGLNNFSETFIVRNTTPDYIGFDNQVPGYTMHNLKGNQTYTDTFGYYKIGANVLSMDDTVNTSTYYVTSDEEALVTTDWLVMSYTRDDFYPEYVLPLADPPVIKNWHIDLKEYLYLNTLDVGVIETSDTDCTTSVPGVVRWRSIFDYIEAPGGVWVLIWYGSEPSNSDTIMAAWKPDGSTVPTRWLSTWPTTGYYNLHEQRDAGQVTYGYVDRLKNTYYIMCSTTAIFKFNMTTEKLEVINIPYTGADIGPLVGIGNDRFVINHRRGGGGGWSTSLINLNDVTSGSTTLSNVVGDICDRAGLDTTTYLDVSQCNNITVPGYTIRDREPARDSIEGVILPFFVDPVVSDWKLKFIPRGSETTNLIEHDDLGCVEGTEYEDPYAITLPEENNLPKEIDFRYLGKNNNYLTSHQRVTRHSKAVNAEDKKTINTFVVLDDAYAKQAATNFLTNAWVNAKRVSIKLPKKYSYLEPTDIIQFYTASGILVTARIVEIMNTFNTLEVGAEIEAYDGYATIDTSDEAAVFDSSTSQKIPLIGTMNLSIIDIFPMFDLYTIPNTFNSESYVYIGGGSYFSSWPGGTVYTSTDNVNFSSGAELNISCITGNIVSSDSLNQYPQDRKIIDQNTEIVIDFVIDPQLTSVSRETLLKGKVNLLHILNNAGGEVIAAQTVSNVGTRYTFSNLLRGRYHTYRNIASNPSDTAAPGTKVTLIDTNNITQVQMPSGIYDNTYYYKAVTSGVNINNVDSQARTYIARWNDSPPVTHTKVEQVSSDLVFSWVPTSKISGTKTFRNPVLDTNTYKVEIYDGTSSLLRSVEGITTTSYTYTAADMTTDSVTVSSTLLFRVYRLSLVKGYDTYYSDYQYAKDIKSSILDVLEPEMLFLFKEYSSNTLVDEMQTATNSDLILDTGTMTDDRKASVLKENRINGVVQLKDNTMPLFKTSGTTAGSNANTFSFMLIFKLNTLDNNSSLNLRFLTRDGPGTYGQHDFSLNASSSGNRVTVNGDITSSDYLTNWNDPFHVVITTTKVGNVQYEWLYINGVQLDYNIAGSFVSVWSGEFLFGDNLNVAKNNDNIQFEAFSYWNGVQLTADQVQALYKGYLGAKK